MKKPRPSELPENGWAPVEAQRKVAQALRASRKASRVTLRKLSDDVGITYSHLSRIECGHRTIPAIPKMSALAEAVGLDPLMLRAIVIADDLTPAQRATLAAHISRME